MPPSEPANPDHRAVSFIRETLQANEPEKTMRPPVFLPHNEPYLGHPTLLEFDHAIPPAMKINARLAQGTFNRQLSPVEQAAAQLIPQAVSIAQYP
jgi:hypothetical protein